MVRERIVLIDGGNIPEPLGVSFGSIDVEDCFEVILQCSVKDRLISSPETILGSVYLCDSMTYPPPFAVNNIATLDVAFNLDRNGGDLLKINVEGVSAISIILFQHIWKAVGDADITFIVEKVKL